MLPVWTKFIILKYKYHYLPPYHHGAYSMNAAALLPLVMVCILATGCVMENNERNITGNVSLTPIPVTSLPVNATTAPLPSLAELKGTLTVSVGGWRGEFPVSVDTMGVGIVSTDNPLVLKIDEGNHTVEICCGMRCEQANVDIRFGKQRTVDFSEQLQRDLGFIEPTVRIAGYRPDGEQMFIDVEFINPTQKPLAISADVSSGYSYIESRTYNRITSIVQSHPSATVSACDRVTQTLNFRLGSGYGYVYDNTPTITNVSSG
jgi:hypothetical protein